jgi:thiamine biosynthesis lipoprotein
VIEASQLGAHRFGHQAMATEFEILCVHPDSTYSRHAAWAAFDLLDRLESQLSKFLPNSDISRINHLAPGETVRVSRWTTECIAIARQVCDETGGAFDISLGGGLEGLRLEPGSVTLVGRPPGPQLDLGGIGKGYALDRMAELLREWDIGQALLHGGHSSVLALDAPPGREGWPVAIGERTVEARRRAFSASGIRVKGRHIVDPRTGSAARRDGAWVSLRSDLSRSSCALAEAYSTAFMVLPAGEVDAVCFRHPGLEATLLEGLCEHNS